MLGLIIAAMLAATGPASHPVAPKPRLLPLVDISERVIAAAVLLSPSILLTASHAADQAQSVFFVRCGDEIISAKVVKRGVIHDLALLVLSNRCLAVEPVELGEADPEENIAVEVLGFPNRIFKRSTGTADGFKLFWNEKRDCFWLGLTLTVIPEIDKGNSGGPVIDAKTGHLVGIIHGFLDADGKHVGVAVPISSILIFLNTAS